jgi:Type II secretion system (T2SS), protein E, N-terminal domain
MREVVSQTIGQLQKTDGYQTIKYSQDMASVIRQVVTMYPSHFSQFVLVTIKFHFAVMNNPSHVRSVTQERSAHYLLRGIRTHVRQSDLVWLKDTTCYFLLAEASLQGGEIVQHRLWKVLQENIRPIRENTIQLPRAITIGHAAYPEPSHTVEQCLHDAQMQCEIQWNDDDTRQMPSLPEPDLSMMARQLGVPYLAFLPRTFSNRVRQLIRPELAQELHCFPLGCARNTLTVAMSNPQDDRILARLRQETGMRIFPVLIHPDELQNALKHITN